MTKLDMDVEKVENGYILVLGDGRKFLYKNEKSLSRALLKALAGEPIVTRTESQRKFWKKKVGSMEYQILEHIAKVQYGTVEKFTDLVEDRYASPRSTTMFAVGKAFRNLVRKGFIVKTNKNSKKYELTDLRPTHVVETHSTKSEVHETKEEFEEIKRIDEGKTALEKHEEKIALDEEDEKKEKTALDKFKEIRNSQRFEGEE